MASEPASERILRDIEIAIQQRVEEAKEEVIRLAKEQFEKELRVAVGQVAINLTNYFSVQRMGPNLVITVKVGPEGYEGRKVSHDG